MEHRIGQHSILNSQAFTVTCYLAQGVGDLCGIGFPVKHGLMD